MRNRLSERGEIATMPGFSPVLARSWQRCVSAGLSPERPRNEARHLDDRELGEAMERQSGLTARARPIIEYLHSQIRDSGCIILLSDQNGFLLDAVGDPGFSDRAAQVALRPGACWAENDRGTNAVGTALIEAAPVVIHGPEHFLERNGFLACAAAPLAASDGSLLGVLDISCDYRIYHPHTFGLVRAAAQMIENRMFEISHVRDIKLRFHASAQALGTVVEGVLAITPDGRILGANRPAVELLGLRPADMGRKSVNDAIDCRFGDLLARDCRPIGEVAEIRRRDGGRLYLRLEVPRIGPPRRAPPSPAWPADALAALDTGDAQMTRAIGQLRRVLDKPIPILLRGETGVGKDVLARAIHDSGPRRGGAFVAVNCAALPENLIEAELFGYAPGAFTGARREGSTGRIREAQGGTLFLDEIGDMPLSMQTRLLRVLEERIVTPLAGRPVPVDFALISATNRDLKADIAQGRFRSDLFYRLNGLGVSIPPLRHRSDLDALITRILAQDAGQGPTRIVSDALLDAFRTYAWPGNLRQLSSLLRIANSMCDPEETEIGWQHLPDEAVAELRSLPASQAGSKDSGGAASLRDHSDQIILRTIEASNGNMSAAARRLGISRNTLYRRIAAIPAASVAEPNSLKIKS
ncbi:MULTISPECIES: sigma-54-dependent Fis family transcriptional regulator [Acidiphilium]|uniref:Sigma-54-dependent Fis family transcriptional regulator n=1 Tax=Acidiphilium iwatense TaxID=768198 RepID=A0ABS9E191_9PROT|nr:MULTISPECIES: sigma-54-dependent Fis family transcriptional regulator [Acidiphilium]MCF3948703.1 sigma-54-dependent Fis family transcriptional regulator [Acidiphilium iwatense]